MSFSDGLVIIGGAILLVLLIAATSVRVSEVYGSPDIFTKTIEVDGTQCIYAKYEGVAALDCNWGGGR